MFLFEPPCGRIEKQIFFPSHETHGSLTLAPVKLVIGVTTPSGEMGESLYRLPSAQLRLSVSSPAVFTKTIAAVVSSWTMRSSGALWRQPANVSARSATRAPLQSVM